MQKRIRFFLVTENEREEDEFLELCDFVAGINEYFERRYRISVELCCLEDPDAPPWKQARYQQQIRESEAVFFLLFMRMSPAITEGFEAAWEQLQKNGKPKIYTYFYACGNAQRGQAVRNFMERLDKEIGHYHTSYSHVDTIKLKILEVLTLQHKGLFEITCHDGSIMLDGKDVLSVEHVPLYANNDQLRLWRQVLALAEEQYFPMKAEYQKRQGDVQFMRTYSEAASRRQHILEMIEETERTLFEKALSLTATAGEDELTPRQKMAYHLFEQGDSAGANAIMDADEMNADFRRDMHQEEAKIQRKARIHIREFRTKIVFLETLTSYPERFADIEAAYEEIMRTALRYHVEYDDVRMYADFLDDQNQSQRALEIARKLEMVYELEEVSEELRANLWNTMGLITRRFPGMQVETEQYYLRSLEYFKKQTAQKPDEFSVSLAAVYSNLGLYFQSQNNFERSEYYYLEAVELLETLTEQGVDWCFEELASCYNMLGALYNVFDLPEEAADCLQAALEIGDELMELTPETFSKKYADICNYSGQFFTKQGMYQDAEACYAKALRLVEELAQTNAERFTPNLIAIHNNLGYLYAACNRTKKARLHYEKALQLCEQFDAHYVEIYADDFTTFYYNIAMFFSRQGECHRAEKIFLQALELSEELAEKNMERYVFLHATVLNNFGLHYMLHQEKHKAKEMYSKAFSLYEQHLTNYGEVYLAERATIADNLGYVYSELDDLSNMEKYYTFAMEERRLLAAQNPDRHIPNYAQSCNNLGYSYLQHGVFEKAEPLLMKALSIYKDLAGDLPDNYLPDLANTLLNCGVLYVNYGSRKKGLHYYEACIQIYEQLYETIPELVFPNYAAVCMGYGRLTDSTVHLNRAIAIAQEYPNHPICQEIIHHFHKRKDPS